MAGRPALVGSELHSEIVRLRRDGYSAERCANELGVSRSTVFRTLAWAREQRDEAQDAGVDVLGERWWEQPHVERELVAQVERAGQGDWKASAWLLERIAPERWGPQARSRGLHAHGRDDSDGKRVVGEPWREVDELARKRRQHTNR